MEITIESDIEKTIKALEGTNKSITSIKKTTLSTISKGAIKAIKQNISATTQKDTGELLKAYKYKVWKDGDGATIFPKGITTEKIFAKVDALNYGVDGQKRIPKCFIESGYNYINSNQSDDEIDKKVEKILEGYWSKN